MSQNGKGDEERFVRNDSWRDKYDAIDWSKKEDEELSDNDREFAEGMLKTISEALGENAPFKGFPPVDIGG